MPKKFHADKLLIGFIVLCTLLFGIWLFLSTNAFDFLIDQIHTASKLPVFVIELLGYPGIVILMAMESMIFPLPSELVMPFAGFLAAEGKMDFWIVIFFSTVGSIIGSLISYAMGYYGGHRFVKKFGKYFLLDEADLKKTEGWFQHQGEKTIFLSRFVPVVRHLISIPAGIGKMDLLKFSIYTILGATMWNGFLAWCGLILGNNWGMVRHYTEYLSLAMAFLLVVASIYMIKRHLRHKTQKTG